MVTYLVTAPNTPLNCLGYCCGMSTNIQRYFSQYNPNHTAESNIFGGSIVVHWAATYI